MFALRGATTVQKDCEEEITLETVKLVNKILICNGVMKEEICYIMFSSTEDLKSFYSAKALRLDGFSSVPLFSTLEPPIENSLKKCIRVLILVNGERNNNFLKHIYMNGAKILRTDMNEEVINIAFDGPAGAGKSTIAKNVSKKLKMLYLDTGAMYRATGLKSIKNGVDSLDEEGVSKFIDDIDLDIKYIDGEQHTFLDKEDVSKKIREPHISMLASNISSLKCVRLKMVELQREIASKNDCILDGRDIGSFVLPKTPYKFFITADSMVRAERRFKELKEKGFEVDLKKIHEEIILRDNNDRNRDFAPLKKADDAIEVDTSKLNIEEVTNLILDKIYSIKGGIKND